MSGDRYFQKERKHPKEEKTDPFKRKKEVIYHIEKRQLHSPETVAWSSKETANLHQKDVTCPTVHYCYCKLCGVHLTLVNHPARAFGVRVRKPSQTKPNQAPRLRETYIRLVPHLTYDCIKHGFNVNTP
eukprot:gene7304-5146_t